MNKQQAGSKGGRVTVERHGRDHMRTIGKLGAAATWKKYFLAPWGQSRYAIVERGTFRVVRVKR